MLPELLLHFGADLARLKPMRAVARMGGIPSICKKMLDICREAGQGSQCHGANVVRNTVGYRWGGGVDVRRRLTGGLAGRHALNVLGHSSRPRIGRDPKH
ncbi:protein of unknown function [Rhodovastum atsumiense]|nr:protein of unknown function [Rhodovastum atsumiense]